VSATVAPRRVSRVRVLIRQIRYQSLLLLRSPSAPFFTFVVPVMILVVLALVYGSRELPGHRLMSSRQFYLSSMIAFATVNACYINVINGTTLARQSGMLKRIRSTPLPGWVYLSGRVISAATVGMLSALGVIGVSVALFDGEIVWNTVPGTLVTIVMAMACFACLGLALTPLVPTPEAAVPIAYGTMLPLSFISDVFFPSDTSTSWLRHFGSVFPLRPFARALADNFTPHATGSGFHWFALGTIAAWTAGGAVMLVFFRWEPARSRSGGRS
jgi:ABC-2 type transport system permease protein